MINAEQICHLLKRKSGPFLKDILNDLEYKILKKELINEQNVLEEYIINNYNN